MNGHRQKRAGDVDPVIPVGSLSSTLEEVLFLTAGAVAVLGALDLMISSARSSGDGFRAAVRHADQAAAAELALLGATSAKLLADKPTQSVVVRNPVQPGAPVVT
jgi:hypothetical protein